MPPTNDGVELIIPIDASGIEEFEPGQIIKVGVQARDGTITSQRVELGRDAQAKVAFRFAAPTALRVAFGPDDATDEELMGLQTINIDISPRQWQKQRELVLEPVKITPHFWHWWLRWCRTFVIRGKVVCPNGNPVPGATVCAFDVDWWWWWCSRDQVGCATTDETGSFEIKFRWCCGWWPWWWWRHRIWHVEPRLADVIMPELQRTLKLPRPLRPSPKPSLDVFETILAGDAITEPNLNIRDIIIAPDMLEPLRERLLERLPFIPRLERLQLWPWWKWQPWWDCTPDIIFQVTQTCLGEEKVIVNELCWDTRHDIPTQLDVTLVANEEACCITQCTDPQECPEGNCVVLSHACSVLVANIGGNPDAAPTPAGYANPGAGDNPFAGVIPIRGVFGDLANVDYYEFEWSENGGASWNAMPPDAAGGFNRTYWGPKLGTMDPPAFHNVPFPFTTISGRRVIETREHFEDNNEPATWGSTRFWVGDLTLLMRWLTENTFADGTYELRLRAWSLVGSNLDNSRILPLCDTNEENGIVLTLDNRLVGDGSGHPLSTPDHPCGQGTVHLCTLEPDTDIRAVRINGAPVDPCTIVQVNAGDVLQIDFLAHDPDAHLSHYSLVATYGENLARNLLTQPSTSLIPLTAAQEGPTYGAAVGQGATRPHWAGGIIRLEMLAAEAFPETCAYQLELRAFKRTIYNCDGNFPHRNLSEYSFTVMR